MKVEIFLFVAAVAVTSTISGAVFSKDSSEILEKSDVTGISSIFPAFPIESRGDSNSVKIVNGEEASPGEFPHQISLQVRRGGEIYHQCGGTIYDEITIITAAHCVEGQRAADLRIVAGDHNIFTVEGQEQVRNVSSYIYNPAYDSAVIDNDTAIIKLDEPLEFNSRVQPLKLADSTDEPIASLSCTVIGWGNQANDGSSAYPEILMKTNLEIVDRKECSDIYATINKITDGMLCARRFGGHGSCNGDSGGPLICKNGNGENFLAAIVSWGIFPCGQDSYPSVFANVAHYRSWFDFVI